MAWENGYDILGSAGSQPPLAFLDWPPPALADVLLAIGATEGLAPGSALSPLGPEQYSSLGRSPAPGSRFPALGFDPAPGDLAEISRLITSLTKAADKLGNAHDLLQRIQDDKTWQGQAADAFHEHLESVLPKYLEEGQQSLSKAAYDLRGWSTRLEGYQGKARAHESDADSARSSYRSAWAAATEAAANNRSALALQGRQFSTDAELQQANAKIKAALSTIEDAVRRVDNAYSTLHQIITDAKSLADTHREDANALATTLRRDAKDFAPQKPNWISGTLGWLKDHGGDILSAIAAVSSVIALFCPVFALVAIAASAGALAWHGTKMWKSGGLWPPTKGGVLSNWATLGGDLLGTIPAVGVVARTANLMKDAGEVGEVAGALTKTKTVFQSIKSAGKEFGGDNAISPTALRIIHRAVDGDGTATSAVAKETAKRFQVFLNSAGATTATAGLVPQIGGNDEFSSASTALGIDSGAFGASDYGMAATEKLKNLIHR